MRIALIRRLNLLFVPSHRSCYLRNLRECIVYNGSKLIDLMKTRKDGTEDESTQGSFDLLLKLAQLCELITERTRDPEILVDKKVIRECIDSLTIKAEVKRNNIVSAQPYEIIASGIVPALLNCLEASVKYVRLSDASHLINAFFHKFELAYFHLYYSGINLNFSTKN